MIEEVFDRTLLALRDAAGDKPLSIFIDPTLRDPTTHDELLHEALQQALAARLASHHRLAPIHDDFNPQRQPFLIHVASEPAAERLVAAALRVALAEAWETESPEFTGRSVCGFILHDANPIARAHALAVCARAIKPDGRRHFLRLWDPRVCWHLPHRLTGAQWAVVSSGMGRWAYVDPLRQLATLQPDETVSLGETTPQRIDASTWQSLERIASTNKLLAMCWDWGLQPSVTLARQIDELLVRSAQQGFDSEQDVLVFAACGLTAHPQFDRHPQVHDALRRAALAGAPLQSALAVFDANFWSQLQADTRWLTDLPSPSPHGTTKRAPA